MVMVILDLLQNSIFLHHLTYQQEPMQGTVRDVNYQEMQVVIEEFLTFHFLVMDLKSL